MILSARQRRFGVRLIAAALLASATMIALPIAAQPNTQANPADEPPEPPVARNDEYYPISYRSFSTDISDDREDHDRNGARQGTMTWSEWWYSYDRVDYTYLVGIGLLTLTPISPSVTNWQHLEDFSVDLAHDAQGCIYQASKPDENGPGIQLSAGLTISSDGPEISGGATWGVLAAGVTVTDVTKDGQRVSWTADISDGSATASGGVNDLLFFGEWKCPKGMDFHNTHVLGVGSFEFDDWGPGDTEYVWGGNGSLDTFPSTGSSAPLGGSSRGYWRFDPEKDRWVHMPDYYDRHMRQASRGRIPESQVTQEERVAKGFIGAVLGQVQRDRASEGYGQQRGAEERQVAYAADVPAGRERILSPKTDGDRKLRKLYDDVRATEQAAEEYQHKCKEKELQQQKDDAVRLEAEAQRLARAAKEAGQYSEIDAGNAEFVAAEAHRTAETIKTFKARTCPESTNPVASSTPAETGRPLYASRQASDAEQAKYTEQVETEFANVEDARVRKDCRGWKMAHERLRGMLNGYRANSTGLIAKDKQFGWIRRMQDEERMRPTCADEEQASGQRR
jgi:hypothetical protein